MKQLIFALISFLTLNCQGQHQDFDLYLSNFRVVELPVTIDRKTYNTIFYPNNSNHEITEALVKKYVCKDSLKCVVNPEEYRYDYGVKINFGNIYAVLIHKQKYEGTTPYDFDLSEAILIMYSKEGKILSEQTLGKDNDGWISSVYIEGDKVRCQQIKILEFNKPELSCEIEVKEYKIGQGGNIELIKTEPIRKGAVIWDEQMKDFTLK